MRRADAGIVRLVFSGFLDCPAGATANPGLVFLGFPALRGRGGLVFTGFPDVFHDSEAGFHWFSGTLRLGQGESRSDFALVLKESQCKAKQADARRCSA